jgi:hypothetical protein
LFIGYDGAKDARQSRTRVRMRHARGSV